MPLVLLLSCLGLSPPVEQTVEVRVPLAKSGEFNLGRFVAALAEQEQLPIEAPSSSIALPFEGPAASFSRSILSECLGARVRFDRRQGDVVVNISWDEPPSPALLAARLDRVVQIAEEAGQRASRFGVHARPSYRPNDADRPTVCLLHGINASSRSFVHLIPLLEAEGFGVVIYDYPYNRDLDELAETFARDWSDFRTKQIDKSPWSIVTHSMGGLLARDYVEGDQYRDDVTRLVMIGPPNRGAASAQGQAVLQWLDTFRAADQGRAKVLAGLQDGLGEAGNDLIPTSSYLRELNARPRRAGVAYHILAGDGGFLTSVTHERILTEYQALRRKGGLVAGLVGATLPGLPAILEELSEGTGDGCVAVRSTRLNGVDDHAVIHVDHVALVRGPLFFPEPGPVACWDFLRSRLCEGREISSARPARDLP